MKNKQSIGKRGFTLIELLIVIGIITILASAIIIAINPGEHFKRAREATRVSHANSIVNSIYSYAVDNDGNLPPCTDDPATAAWSGAWVAGDLDWDDLDSGYFGESPTWGDVTALGAGSGEGDDEWNNERPLAACGDDLAAGESVYLPDLPLDPGSGHYYTIASNSDGTRIQISTSAYTESKETESNMRITQ